MFDKKKKDRSERARMSKINPIPLYRSYGVTRRENELFEKIKLWCLRITVSFIMSGVLLIAGVAILMFFIYGNILLNAIVIAIAAVVIFIRLTRIIRKRIKFQRKLKKFCKKNNYRLKFEQNFIKSLVWSADKLDFTLHTGTHSYLVHYLTISKYNSSLLFETKGEIKHVKKPLDNKFTLLFDLREKVKTYNVSFSEAYEMPNKKNVRAVVVNPVCKEMFYKDKDGSIAATGNGAEIFGITVFTGSGFIEAVKRNEADFSYKKSIFF